VVSAEGGIDIEEVASKTPENSQAAYRSAVGDEFLPARELAFRVYSNPDASQAANYSNFIVGFIGDASLARSIRW
jgi:succinyl-CoA synthetase beta subunit